MSKAAKVRPLGRSPATVPRTHGEGSVAITGGRNSDLTRLPHRRRCTPQVAAEINEALQAEMRAAHTFVTGDDQASWPTTRTRPTRHGRG